MQYPTDEDLKLPTISMTRGVPWDPSRYDKVKSADIPDFDPSSSDLEVIHPNFNVYGEYTNHHTYGEQVTLHMEAYEDLRQVSVAYQRRVASTGELLPDLTDPIHCAYHLSYNSTMYTEIYQCYALLINPFNLDYSVSYNEQKVNPIEYESNRKFFLNQPLQVIRSTYDATTRYYRHVPSTNRFMTYRSPYPALNHFRRHEIVFTDTVFSDRTAWGGIEAAQVFVGKMSRYISVHGCKSDADFARCLEDEIRKRGAMDKLGLV
eukprot:scaffold6063_cov97-Skeletonema_menzelii.AAC.1